jgi:adenylate cyclase
VRRELEQILLSPDFDAAPRSRKFLRFVVEEALAGRGEELTQAALATQVFGRRGDFDPVVDPIVRIQAGRLRRSLERYYLLAGKADSLRIELPRGAYVPAIRSAASPAPAAPPSMEARPPGGGVGTEWPSVTVGPIEGGASNPGQDELATRFADLLTVELGRYHDVRVVIQRPGEAEPRERARFEIRCRLERESEDWVVTVRLLDRTTGEQIWGDEFRTPGPDRRWGSVDDVARVIAARVGAEHGAIVQALWAEYRRRPGAAGGTYAAILGAYNFLYARDLRDLVPAMEGLRKAVAEEPGAPVAWTFLSRLCQINHVFELSDAAGSLDESIGFAYQALRLDPTSVRVRCVLAASLLTKGELESGRDELEQALRQSPGSLVYREMVGWLLAFLGDWERGIALVRDAMERNPYHLPHAHFALWADHLRRGDFEGAYRAALEYRDPAFFWRSLMRACCLGHLGRTEEAEATAAELRKEKPAIEERGRLLIGYYIKAPELQASIEEGLRKAGVTLR